MADKTKTSGASSSAKATEDKPAKPSYEELEAQVAQLTAQKEIQTEREKRIQDKMLKGLTRPQAITVLDRQEAYDTSDIAKERAKRIAKLNKSQS